MFLLLHQLMLNCLNHFNCFTRIPSEQPSIVIIGAGISGLAAADRLINKYKFENVMILEASDRVGGRIYPVPFGKNIIDRYFNSAFFKIHVI